MESQSDWLEVYQNGWSSHEEWDWTTIWETMAGDYVIFKTSYNVYSGAFKSTVTVDEWAAIHEMIEAEERYSD